ncbi:hypothetical protein F5Y12DRAFT_720771 [Xylaria sp. FL1777]|nr:hypothetical protein F5Y12DRAFT_720771 [Xylaria sp. FL1777]
MADRIVMPDNPQILSMAEQRIFINFANIAEMIAENTARLEKIEESIERVEEKLDSMQRSQNIDGSDVVLKPESSVAPEPAQTQPEPTKQDGSPPRIHFGTNSPRRLGQGTLFGSSLALLPPPRTPHRASHPSSATTPRKRKFSPRDKKRPLGRSLLWKSIDYGLVELQGHSKEADVDTKAQDDKEPDSPAAGGSIPPFSSPRLHTLASPFRLQPSSLRERLLLDKGLKGDESKAAMESKRPPFEDSESKDGKK